MVRSCGALPKKMETLQIVLPQGNYYFGMFLHELLLVNMLSTKPCLFSSNEDEIWVSI
jgi:hypothetical protein